jgi:hypothetical protein
VRNEIKWNFCAVLFKQQAADEPGNNGIRMFEASCFVNPSLSENETIVPAFRRWGFTSISSLMYCSICSQLTPLCYETAYVNHKCLFVSFLFKEERLNHQIACMAVICRQSNCMAQIGATHVGRHININVKNLINI